jgi:CRISPR-associated protein (TIGR03984 family)
MDNNSFGTLADALNNYKDQGFLGEKAFAILYTPQHCHLALVDNTGKFFNQAGEFIPQGVFEARIFNDKAELRWLHESNGKGRFAIISDSSFPNNAGTIKQTYLLWGESMGPSQNGWTEFAEARIGSFLVPVAGLSAEKKCKAQFTAIEYLGEFEDGNVAVVDERLTGIEFYEEEKSNG